MKKVIISTLFTVLVSINVQASNVQLETIGAATGSNLVITYVALGMAGDAYAKKVYSKNEAKDIVEMLNGQITLMEERLAKLIKSKVLDSDDNVFVKKMLNIYKSLGKQGKALLASIKKGKTSNQKKFEKYRQESQKKLSELLNSKK